MTRESKIVQQQTEKHGKNNIRYVTIPIGLRQCIADPELQQRFLDISRNIGVFRHVVSLIANECLCKNLELLNVNDSNAWKTFYGNVWTAVDAVVHDRKQRAQTPTYHIISGLLCERKESLRLCCPRTRSESIFTTCDSRTKYDDTDCIAYVHISIAFEGDHCGKSD